MPACHAGRSPLPPTIGAGVTGAGLIPVWIRKKLLQAIAKTPDSYRLDSLGRI
jgi:hypothetical protein